ncbi:two-component sensor histidine kinase [Alicyclobacillus acidoterrestris]|nr:two-component sensor histidine kinase [Alicyclobacillus acidoterrestris]
MLKTLYLRTVFTFLAIVLISISVAFFVTSHLYTKQSQSQMRTDIIKTANQAIVEYKHHSLHDFANYAHVVASMQGYDIEVYNGASSIMNGRAYGVNPNLETPVPLVQQVLAGNTVELFDGAYHTPMPHHTFVGVGIPFSIGQTQYAMFVSPRLPPPPPRAGFPRFLVTVLLIVLVVGSLLILVASRYLIRPIQMITAATRRVAKGDFDVAIRFNRSDEIGVLAESFTAMTQELKQMETMRQDFVSNVSHEIQSPLTSIRGFSKALREGIIPEHERDRYLEAIEVESERISRMSENLLKLASLESDHHPIKMKSYRLDEQIRRTILITEPQWSEKDLHIELELPKTVLTADQDLLEQVWMNLLVNSIRYTPFGGRLMVRITSDETNVKVQVEDTGIGIPKSEQQKVFERFYKVDKARSRVAGGSGLGLSIVKRIVDLHQGQIQLESDVGRGTTFTVILPTKQNR